MDRLPIVIDGVYQGYLTAKATPDGLGYTVFPTKWVQVTSTEGLPATKDAPFLGSLRIALPPSLKSSAKLSFLFYPHSFEQQDIMYSICEASREEDPTPYVCRGHSVHYPLPIDKTFVDATTSTSLLVSRSTEVRQATLVSEGASLNLNKPSTFKSGVYRAGIGMEKAGVDAKEFLDKTHEEVIKGKETLDANRLKEAELKARLALYEGPSFNVEEWLKDYAEKRQDSIGDEWKISFGSALRFALADSIVDNHQASKKQGGKKSAFYDDASGDGDEYEEEASAGGAGGLFDDDGSDDEDWDGPSTTRAVARSNGWNGCDPGCSMPSSSAMSLSPPTKNPQRANLFTRNQTTSSYRVNTDHIVNRFTFCFAVEIVEGFDESYDGSSDQTSFYTLDTKMRRVKKELSSQVMVSSNQIRTLERQIAEKEGSMKRSYENRVALVGRAMEEFGHAYGEVLVRRSMDSVWTSLGMKEDIEPFSLASMDEKVNDAIESIRTYLSDRRSTLDGSENVLLNLLFEGLLTGTFSLSTDLLKDILAETKDKVSPVYRYDSSSDEEESAGGTGGIFDDDDDDW